VDLGRDPAEITAIVLLDVAIIVLVARGVGDVFRRIGQPAVIGEIVAGLLLGPTLLGAFPGDLTSELFPDDVRPTLQTLGDLGLIVFVFAVGLQLDPRLVRRLGRAATISASSVALPFALGCLLAVVLHPSHDTVDGSAVPFAPFALFMGVALSITAFPVLARILLERGMHETPVGALVLACAAAEDVIGWAILALALAVLAGDGAGDTVVTVIETAAFAVVLLAVVRPILLRRVGLRVERAGGLTPDLLALVVAAIGVSAWITYEIGVNFVFGAFLLGIAFPREHAGVLLAGLRRQIDPFVSVVLLPIFFVLPGLGIDLWGLGLDDLGALALILLAACAGKLVGGGGAAKLLGSDWREAATIGTLLNTRGVMELVVLNVGLAAGVLDADLYAILVVMAIVTTLMTAPIVRRTYPPELVERDAARHAPDVGAVPDPTLIA
jgi:Kef-type K+ transport system membrane component KefB